MGGGGIYWNCLKHKYGKKNKLSNAYYVFGYVENFKFYRNQVPRFGQMPAEMGAHNLAGAKSDIIHSPITNYEWPHSSVNTILNMSVNNPDNYLCLSHCPYIMAIATIHYIQSGKLHCSSTFDLFSIVW